VTVAELEYAISEMRTAMATQSPARLDAVIGEVEGIVAGVTASQQTVYPYGAARRLCRRRG
jgi:hypothetical protein